MEDILDVYQRPYDLARPVVCFDETRKELHTTPRGELPRQPGQPTRQDYEYQRNGAAHLFLWVEPLTGRRGAQVTEQHTGYELAEVLRHLAEDVYVEAEQIVLVCDNLNTHHAGVLYERFLPEQARRIAARLEWHYTPEHGSWLNVAECELSVLSRQCLDRRIPDREALAFEVAAWEQARNARAVTIDWQFRTADARIKLKRLYPEVKHR
jgi:hypothetical protein